MCLRIRSGVVQATLMGSSERSRVEVRGARVWVKEILRQGFEGTVETVLS
jgi:hypothetical protein